MKILSIVHIAKKFETLQHCLVPRSKNFSVEQQKLSLTLIDRFINEKPILIALKIIIFIYLIDLVSTFKFGKFFSYLTNEQKNKLLNSFFDSPIPLMRKGFWGINTLAKLGVYTQQSIYPDIHYYPEKGHLK